MTPEVKAHILRTGFIPIFDHGYHVNDKVRIVHIPYAPLDNCRPGFGTVIAIIGYGMELTKEEAMEVYQVPDDHRYLQNFMKPIKVDRIVVRRDDKPSNLIVPSSKLGLALLRHI